MRNFDMRSLSKSKNQIRQRPIVVVMSVAASASGSNTYLELLVDSVASSEVDVRWFTWGRALFGSYEIFHLHWPEHLANGRNRAVRIVKVALLFLLVARLRAASAVVVETVHNLTPHKQPSALMRLLLSRLDGLVIAQVHLTRETMNRNEGRRSIPGSIIPHGLYREWIPTPRFQPPGNDGRPIRLLTFGLIKKYKNVPELIRVIGASANVNLTVAGSPESVDLTHEIEALADNLPHVSAKLKYLTEDELRAELADCHATVLPYQYFMNSGALFLSLSARRPVIIPNSPSARELREEFGEDWIFVFDPPLSNATFETVSRWLRSSADRSCLSARGRGWEQIGLQHLAFYRAACANAQPPEAASDEA